MSHSLKTKHPGLLFWSIFFMSISGMFIFFTPATAWAQVFELPPSPGAVLLVTLQATSSITQTTAIGNGTIASLGAGNAIERGVVYGLTASYGSTVSETGGSYGAGAFQESLTGLTCNTLYHIAPFATDSSSTVVGLDATFTTSACTVVASSSSSHKGSSHHKKKKKKGGSSIKIVIRAGERVAPFITLSSPRVGTFSTKSISFQASARDRSGIQAMILTVNGIKKKGIKAAAIAYTLSKPKNSTVAVNAYDSLGNRKTAEATIVQGKVVRVRYW